MRQRMWLAGLALAAAAFAQKPVYYSVSGHITGLQEGHGAVVVRAVGPRNYQVTVRADGTWTINSVLAGKYRLNPSGAQYAFSPPYRTVALTSADADNVNFAARLKAGGAAAGATTERFEMTGRVTGLAPGHHATIRAAGAQTRSTTTRSDGTWSLAGLLPGLYNVTATHTQYHILPEFRRVDATRHDVHNVNFGAHRLESKTGR